MGIYTNTVQKLYVAFFNRPGDAVGVANWEEVLTKNGGNVAAVAAAFGGSSEYTSLFAGKSVEAIVDTLYQNLFGRPAEAAGLLHWSKLVANGSVTVANLALTLANSAQGTDMDVINNKIAAAVAFTNACDTREELIGYSGLAANEVSRAWLSTVSFTATSLTAATAKIDATLAEAISAGNGLQFNLKSETAAGADVMRISGNQTVRIDLTDTNKQIKGLDLNGNGVIDANGIENNSPKAAAGFEIVDAYARNPKNEGDVKSNFKGDIAFDGTGYAGDGVNTDGNIYLGGIGIDTALGGIGNDFMAGGGVASGRYVNEVNAQGNAVIRDTLTNKIVSSKSSDMLSGGRNADFFFAEFSKLDNTDGNGTTYDGGSTTDDAAAGLEQAKSGVNSQNNDWLLVEASDDDEPVSITLGDGKVETSQGAEARLKDIESIDASGNLYGMLNDVNVKLGGRSTDSRSTNPVAGTENYGIGSSGQLNVTGSTAANVIIAGYDNDKINGGDGNDILAGGNLKYLVTHKNNPNLLNANGGLELNVSKVGTVTDGRDDLLGGKGNDSIVFEMDGGNIDGGEDVGNTPTSVATTGAADRKVTGDTLYLTETSMGRVQGATAAGEATAQADALAKVTTDKTVRLDLGNDSTETVSFKNYGGSNVASQDQTNYATGLKAVAMKGMESVIATGMGAIDYKAAGANSPELTFNNQQNYKAIDADLSLRGNAKDNTLYANTGKDVVEGREGDDNLSGGTGDDTFVFDFGDGVDIVHRQKDSNNDNLWDADANGNGLFVQDFRAPQAGDIASSRLVVDFGTTDLTSANVAVTSFNLKIGGVSFSVADAAALSGAKSAAALATVVNNAYKAIDANVSVTAVGNTLVVVDKTGRDISDTIPEGYGVGVVLGNGSASTTATFAPGGTPINVVENDKIIFKDYASRANNLGKDATLLEIDQAASLTTRLTATGSQLAQAQTVLVRVNDAQQGDKVTVTINGKEFSYTAKSTETSQQVINGLAAVINADLDGNSAAGKVVADAALANNPADGTNFPNLPLNAEGNATALNGAQLILTQSNISGSMTYMNVAVSVTNTLANGSSATVSTHDNSGNHIDLLGYDGRNGNLNGDIVQFQGMTTESKSLLQTAKNTGETITGKDANAVTNAPTQKWINGDDLLIGGDGNDTINAGTGDDRILVSRGNDTVDGGANGAMPVTNGTFVDTLQAEEQTFGAGTSFTVTLSDTLGAVGAGTVQALDGKAAVIGTTTFTNIETVRVLENNRTSTLDVKGLSDKLATTIGNNTFAGEGLTVNMLVGNASVEYTADLNDSLSITGAAGSKSPDYNQFRTTATFGTENLITGNANDAVNMDQSQVGANNNINLGAQQDNTVAATLAEGADAVNYSHTGLSAANQVTMTIKVESAANVDTVSATGGELLGTTVTTDTLTNVEVVSVANAARAAADVLDLSATAGATVNFAAGSVGVGRSFGGQNKADSVANIEANTLEDGGISVTHGTQGNELLEVVGITQVERITGSAGVDRVIVGNGSAFVNANFNTGAAFDDAALGFNFHGRYTTATRTFDTTTKNIDNKGLYQFDLGDGVNDALDYRQSGDGVAVVVDFAGVTGDFVVVDENLGGNFQNGSQDRIDIAKNVERFYASSVATTNNVIDLSQATEAVSVTFGAENKAAGNEFKDQNGIDANAGTTKTPDDQVTGINVSTATNASVARFMEASANAATGTTEALWGRVEGSNQNDTIVASQYQDRLNANTFNLRGGSNRVDYTNAVKVGQNDVYTLLVSDHTVGLNTTSAHSNIKMSHTSTDSVGAIVDTISLDRQVSTTNAVLDGALTVVGSVNSNDVVDISTLGKALGLDNTLANDLTGTKRDGSATSEEANVTDITGTAKGGYNLVDLGSGVGVTSGQVIQDAALNFKGQTAIDDNVITSISNFEHIVGSAFNDRLFGNDSSNTITGGLGNNIYVGRGGGDTLNLSAAVGSGSDRVVYNAPGDTADVAGGTAANGEFDVINGFDTVGEDHIVFDLTTTAANGGFNLANSLVQVVDFAVTKATIATGAIILQEANGVAADADLLTMTQVASKLANGGATFTANVANGTQALFAVEGTTQTGIYVWTQANGDAVVDAAELRLLTVLNGQTIDAADAAATIGVKDFAIRQTATVTGVADTVLFTNGVRNEIAYTALGQSQYGQIDTIGKYDALGAVVNGFVSGEDKIDLSGLNLGATDGLALNAIVTRDRTGAGSQITDANANDFFYDGGNVRRSVVVEFDNDDIDGGLAGTQGRARIFVDMNGDGQLNTTQDLFIDVATVGTAANVPVYTDFVFVV
ncbi:DUF4214 domain-containing protein [Noviherbaspirillum sp.]|uniref:DUF4214 domain-containing protein n=1 Tax=Noviherbaspirillum sp. TaxID=1926288 RepID=UPI002FE0FED2